MRLSKCNKYTVVHLNTDYILESSDIFTKESIDTEFRIFLVVLIS